MLKSMLFFILLLNSLFNIIAQELSFTPGRYEFAIELFRNISSTKFRENLLISPASIQTAMVLLYMGSNGNNEIELRKCLHLESFKFKEIISDDYVKFLNMATKNEMCQLDIANRIFVKKELKVQAEFNELAEKYFHSGVEAVDFLRKTETAKLINDWVRLKTHGKITEITQAGNFDNDTQMVILNAMYLKAQWLFPFSKMMTENLEFSVTPRKKSMALTMTRWGTQVRHVTFPDLGATAIELPYNNSNLRMLIFKPNNIVGLRKLERSLKMEHLMAFPKTLEPRIVNIRLPKFQMGYKTELKETLKKMGMKDTFNPRLSDFKKIFENDVNPAISEVIHKTFIDVNEVGTDAAAATLIQMNRFVPLGQPIDFYVNHPFLFVISDEYAVYWIGHVVEL